MARATNLKDRTGPALTASAVVIGPEATLSAVDRTARRTDWPIPAPPAINRTHHLGSIRPNLRIHSETGPNVTLNRHQATLTGPLRSVRPRRWRSNSCR